MRARDGLRGRVKKKNKREYVGATVPQILLTASQTLTYTSAQEHKQLNKLDKPFFMQCRFKAALINIDVKAIDQTAHVKQAV